MVICYIGGLTLTDLFAETFTIINQIPTSATNPAKIVWKVSKIKRCSRHNGIYDQSAGGMGYKADAWTVRCKEWQSYRPPMWTENGYYTIPDDEKSAFYTASVGDLVVFADISDPAPTSVAEFNALVQKYRNNGGVLTAAESYVHHDAAGIPWETNHIKMVRG